MVVVFPYKCESHKCLNELCDVIEVWRFVTVGFGYSIKQKQLKPFSLLISFINFLSVLQFEFNLVLTVQLQKTEQAGTERVL